MFNNILFDLNQLLVLNKHNDKNNNLVTINIYGGLGNQLFQVATLISYGLKNKIPFFFQDQEIINGWRKKKYFNTIFYGLKSCNLLITSSPNRCNILNDINNEIIYDEDTEFKYKQIPIPSELIKKKSDDYSLTSNTNPNLNLIKLNGYFQSYKYFLNYNTEIMNLLHIGKQRKIIKEKLLKVLPELNNEINNNTLHNTVSVHFRIGDYIKYNDVFKIMPSDYYEDALLQLLKDMNNNAVKWNNEKWIVLFFCEENDINECLNKINHLKNNTKIKNNFSFIRAPNININNVNNEDWEELLMMSLCQHHIIANSTFSWWGAYIRYYYTKDKILYNNSSIETRVYYPSRWFGKQLENNEENYLYNLFPKEWTKININHYY